MPATHQPRRAPLKKLEGAPSYILGVYDAGAKVNDRYTVLLGDAYWDQSRPEDIQYLCFNEMPTSPNMGVSMFGEMKRHWGREGLGRLIAWSDLPEALQQHVIARTKPDQE